MANMSKLKLIALSLGLVLVAAFASVGVANAQSFKAGDNISVAAGEIVNSMFFAAGGNIDIVGTVNGDVYCAGQTITISGTVKGDVICAGQTLVVSGHVEGSVRLAGQNITVSGTVGNSATIGAQDLVIDKSAVISRDLLGASQNVTINGTVGRDVVSGATNLTINGKVTRDINGNVDTLTVGSGGVVGGNVNYTSINDPVVATGGKIAGVVSVTQPDKQSKATQTAASLIGWFIYALVAMVVTAMVLVAIMPRVFHEAATRALKNPGQTTLVGVVAALFIPVLIFMLVMSFIGLPLAALATFAWLVLMTLSGPFAGYILGRLILSSSKNPYQIMLLGVGVLVVTYFIPFVGMFMVLAAYLFGMGMVLVQSKQLLARIGSKRA